MTEKKPLLVHFHIMKNAGGTVEWILEKNFGKNFAMTQYEISKEKTFPLTVLLDYLGQSSEIKAFSSQMIRYPLPSSPLYDFLPIIFIRHPIDRAFSLYYFFKRKEGNAQGSLQEKKLNLSEFIQWVLYKSNYPRLIKNGHLQFLSDKTLNSRDERIESAIERIKNCPFLGVVDRFDESMVIAEENLGKYFKNLDLAYVKQHIANNRSDRISDRIETEKRMVAKDIMEDLIKKNEIDFKLYSIGNNELDRRMEKIDGFQEKLLNFQNRCDEMAKQTKKIESNTLLHYSIDEKSLKHIKKKT